MLYNNNKFFFVFIIHRSTHVPVRREGAVVAVVMVAIGRGGVVAGEGGGGVVAVEGRGGDVAVDHLGHLVLEWRAGLGHHVDPHPHVVQPLCSQDVLKEGSAGVREG